MTADERRKESRIRSRGRVKLVAEGAVGISGSIYDVSISGIGVDTESGISPGTLVRIDGEGFAAEGVVRYCSRRGHLYRVGVALRPAGPA
jgi:hypothetical protein